MSQLSFTRETPSGDGPVIFWAARSAVVGWRVAIVTGLVLSPLAFLAPEGFLAALATAGILALSGTRTFRFELTPRVLRLRLGLLTPVLEVPLSAIAKAEALPDSGAWALSAREEVGPVMIRLRDGSVLPVPGLVEPRAAAEAVNRLAASARRPGAALAIRPGQGF